MNCCWLLHVLSSFDHMYVPRYYHPWDAIACTPSRASPPKSIMTVYFILMWKHAAIVSKKCASTVQKKVCFAHHRLVLQWIRKPLSSGSGLSLSSSRVLGTPWPWLLQSDLVLMLSWFELRDIQAESCHQGKKRAIYIIGSSCKRTISPKVVMPTISELVRIPEHISSNPYASSPDTVERHILSPLPLPPILAVASLPRTVRSSITNHSLPVLNIGQYDNYNPVKRSKEERKWTGSTDI